MTELDNELPGIVSELIGEFGKDIAYTPRLSNGYNPRTSRASTTGDTFLIKGVVEPYRGQRMLAGLVEVNDLKVTAAAADFPEGVDLTPGDGMSFDNKNYNIISILPTYSGELIAIYEFQVRSS